MRKLEDLNFRNNKDGYAISVVIALLVGSILLGYYYVALEPPKEGYMAIYLLNSQKDGLDYPEFLVNNVNNTFSVYVVVENHEGDTVNAQVQLKIARNMNPSFPVLVEPIETFNETIQNGKTMENVATITLNEPGNYSVVFELWTSATNSAVPQFSNDFCVLNVEVV